MRPAPPTPLPASGARGEDGSADLSYVLGVASQLGNLLRDYKIVVNKSTVPVGTAEKVRDAIAKNCKVEFDVVSNPEFLREGFAVDDFMKPDRVVIGTRSELARAYWTLGDLDHALALARQGLQVATEHFALLAAWLGEAERRVRFGSADAASRDATRGARGDE